jgi:hypothetical protein
LRRGKGEKGGRKKSEGGKGVEEGSSLVVCFSATDEDVEKELLERLNNFPQSMKAWNASSLEE